MTLMTHKDDEWEFKDEDETWERTRSMMNTTAKLIMDMRTERGDYELNRNMTGMEGFRREINRTIGNARRDYEDRTIDERGGRNVEVIRINQLSRIVQCSMNYI